MSQCLNPNCAEKAHPMCQDCNPYYEFPKNCVICKGPSKGGRLTCCKRGICQNCSKSFLKFEAVHYGKIMVNGKEVEVNGSRALPCEFCGDENGYILVNENKLEDNEMN